LPEPCVADSCRRGGELMALVFDPPRPNRALRIVARAAES